MSRGRPWSAWARRGSIAMAALAVGSLGATVITSQRALSDASTLVVRGEGDVLLSTLASELMEEQNAPPTDATLARTLEAHAASGLRYVAIVGRDGVPLAEAGRAELPPTLPKAGETRIEGRRARMTGLLTPPRRRLHPPTEPMPFGARARFMGPALLVIELEPPVVETLRRDLQRIGVVAAGAGCVLLAFAFAWSRSAHRLAALEARAAREQRLVALGSMSSIMAHELRNPLASLKGHAQLLVEDLEDGDAKQHAKAARVVAEAERLEGLTATLLDFVRDGPIERTPVTPRGLVDRSLADLPKERVDVQLDGAPETLAVDAARLARAIHNLVDNALQASAEERVELRITADRAPVPGRVLDQSAAIITVRDRGPGLPAGAEAQIFEPFMTTRVRGTGLGLAVARRIAAQHDGTLTAENHADGGALFTLRIRA